MTISPSSRVSSDEVSRRTFTTARKGFAPTEVRAFLDLVARELEAAALREHELRDALAAAERRAANPVLDEATLTTALGQETAKVLRSAHDVAGEIVSRAEADAERVRADAERDSEKLRADAAAEAERLRAEADDEARRVRSEAATASEQMRAHADKEAADLQAKTQAAVSELRRRADEEATGRLESAKAEAESLLSQARAECRAMVHETQEMRTRVLTDLTRRRRVLHSQIEQLRAGRDRMAETITAVRNTVDQVSDELFRAEDEARLAAEAAARHAAPHDDLGDVLGPAPSLVAPLAGPLTGPLAELGAPGAGGALEDPDEERRQQAVEELFARLRAQQAGEEEASAPEAGEPPAPSAPYPSASAATGPAATGPAATGPAATGPAATGPVATGPVATGPVATGSAEEGVKVLGPVPSSDAPDAATVPAGAAGAAGAAGVAVAVAEDAAPGAVQEEQAGPGAPAPHPALARRDELLGPAATALTRRLKRAMADDQNDVLDRVRALGSFGPAVLACEGDHQERYRLAAHVQLLEAARAGATLAGGSPDDAPGVDDLSVELAQSVVAPLRRRLLEAPSPLQGDEAAVVEHVGSAYREWKGQRLERVARDMAHAAFWRAALAATPEDQELHWLVDDEGRACPDCDDNALAGALPRGEAFPTGHVHPPAHPGCRCLLVPGPA
jgi:DivIVA domain-containing protein